MKNSEKMLILNTGGTFNKSYNQLNGKLEILQNNEKIEKIVKTFRHNVNVDIKGIIYKDSLELDTKDRQEIAKIIQDYEKVLIIHGTDTMNITAEFLAEEQNLKNKCLVLTGAMIPFSFSELEACANFCLGFGFLSTSLEKGIFISMHGLVKNHKNIIKNKSLGKFECQE